jgi:hypothetical protein
VFKEKCRELRRKRLKDREERFKIERNRIQEQNEALRIRLDFVQKRKECEESLSEKKEEIKDRNKAEEVIENIRKSVENMKEKHRVSEYVPKLANKIENLLSSTESSYRSANYEKVIDLSLELQELITKAEAEKSRIIEEQKKRRRGAGKYFYAVIPLNEGNNFGNIGMNDEEVYTIPYRDLAAVVSDTSEQEYELTEENVRRHEAVLRKIMEEYTIIPAEFGTVIHNDRIMKRLLSKAYSSTKECLKLVDNMVELGVKAIIRNYAVHFDTEHRIITSAEILESLKKNAEQSVSGELFSDRLILNESFLVRKNEVNAFSEEVARLEEGHPTIKFLYSGPWAPYNFVSIKIGKEGMKLSKRM